MSKFIAVFLLVIAPFTVIDADQVCSSTICIGTYSSSLTEQAHNEKRNLHVDTPDLTYDPSLAADAQSCALRIVQEGLDSTTHPCQPKDGENIAEKTTNAQIPDDLSFKSAVNGWYNEWKNFDNPRIFEPGWQFNNFRDPRKKKGHFTQMVWKSTKTVGCGWAWKKDGSRYIIICRYAPMGNSFYGRDIIDNIKPFKQEVSGCSDEQSSICSNYAHKCNDAIFSNFMKEKCKETCGLC